MNARIAFALVFAAFLFALSYNQASAFSDAGESGKGYGLQLQSSCSQILAKGRIRQLASHYDRDLTVSNRNSMIDMAELEAMRDDFSNNRPVLGSVLTIPETFDLNNLNADRCPLGSSGSTPNPSPAGGWACSWEGADVKCEKDGRAWRWRDDDRNNDPRIRGRIFIFDPAGTGTEVFDQCSVAWTSPSRTGTTHTREFSLDPNGPLSASGDPSSWADTACPSGSECRNGACTGGVIPPATATPTPASSGTPISSPTPSTLPPSAACVKLIDNGPASAKLDLVFVVDKYQSISAFAGDVQNAVNTMFSIEPFRSKRNKFNVYYVNKLSDLQCKSGSGGIERAIGCNGYNVKLAAKECPSEKIMVLVNTPQYGGAANGINGDIAAASRVDPLVPAHEFGHLLGLVDEYVLISSSGANVMPAPNCDNTFSGNAQKQCPKWAGVQGTGCYEGCEFPDWYRPTLNSCLMQSLQPQFDPVDVAYLNSYLDGKYGLQDTGEDIYGIYGDILAAKVKYKSGRYSVGDIVREKGYLPEADTGNSELKVFSESGKEIYSSPVNVPLSGIFESFDDKGAISGAAAEPDEFEFALMMPAIGAEKAELHMGDKRVLSFGLTGSKSPISLRKGWNMVSSPVTVPVADIASACPVKSGRAFWYGSNGYESPNSIEPLKGYWLYSDSDCSANVFGEAELTFVSLHPGWNMISGSRSWNEMKGDCERISSVWTWDADGQKYEKIASYEELDPTKGYWMKVRKACTVSS